MRLHDSLRSLEEIRRALDPSDARFATGTEAEQAEARAEWRRQRRNHEIFASKLQELSRSELAFSRRGFVEHLPSGDYYRVAQGELVDMAYTGAVAYFVNEGGDGVLLERPTGIKTRAELEQKQREREERRNAPKPRRAWAKR